MLRYISEYLAKVVTYNNKSKKDAENKGDKKLQGLLLRFYMTGSYSNSHLTKVCLRNYRISDIIPVALPPRVAGDGLEDLTSYFV